eukprot:gene27203-32868_t
MSREFLSEDVYSGLSAETIKALREFALEKGVNIIGDDPEADGSNKDLLQSVHQHFQLQDREEIFHVSYQSNDGKRSVSFDVKGIKRELGWRAAEHLCTYLINEPQVLQNKSICELGAGLGLVSIFVEKLLTSYNIPYQSLISTDGDEDTISLLIENKLVCDCSFDTSYLLWGEHQDFGAKGGGFDVVLGADIIYEKESLQALFETVKDILKPDGVFYLSYARRNVWMEGPGGVWETAAGVGLQGQVVFEGGVGEVEGGGGAEPIYAFTFQK